MNKSMVFRWHDLLLTSLRMLKHTVPDGVDIRMEEIWLELALQ